jgi:ribosomal protein L37E
MRSTKAEKDGIRAYVEDQAHEKVVHLEKAAAELVGPVRHDIWDVHCASSRWWVVTNPTNLYTQEDFKSRDVVLTFHIGLALRMAYLAERDVPVLPTSADLLPGSWRRWQQAFDAYDNGDEAEAFQAVGMRLRECLLSFLEETTSSELVPVGAEQPKDADFRAWTELLANTLAVGESAAKLRSYLKQIAVETWDYVNWLTHAKNAIRMDAEIGLKIVEHLLGVFTAARLRKGRTNQRCEACGSYEVVGGVCRLCGWVDASYEPPTVREWSDEERARRLAEPHTLTSDISTFMSPEDFKS